MPGKTPNEAFSAFVDPLAGALKCIVRTKIQHSEGGRNTLGRTHTLFLTGKPDGPDEGYLRLKGCQLEFMARMRYEIIHDESPRGPYRVTTRAYEYAIQTVDKVEILAYHWHPSSNSHEIRPHLHIGLAQLKKDAVLHRKHHMLTGRVTLEGAIEVAITYGAQPLREDWKDVLAASEGPHLRHRSWHADYISELGTTVDQ